MHSEAINVPPETAEAVEAARRRGGRVVAVGTTVVRALESVGQANGLVEPIRGTTRLFIKPGYRFQVVDGLVTNFHLPGSTLLAMIAAFIGERWRPVYAHALASGYRFLSFGDAMFAFRNPLPEGKE